MQAKTLPTEAIRQAIAFLASVCDEAIEDDDRGFSGADARFGKDLAQRISEGGKLSERQLRAAATMLQKYRNTQLSAIDLPAVDEVDRFLMASRDVETDARVFNFSTMKPKPSKNDRVAVVQGVPAIVALVEVEPAPSIEVDLMEVRPWERSEWREGLSDQQCEAFDLIHEWFFGESPEKYVLKGFAGVGKSFLAQRIAHSIQAIVMQYRPASLNRRLGYSCFWDSAAQLVVRRPFVDRVKIGLCAPTHKAVEVLAKFADEAGLSVAIGTIHSFLHVAPGEFELDGRQKLTEVFSKADHYDSFGLMICDEGSMIGKELLDFIPADIPTLFMGDPAQLPPVCPDEAEPKDSPVFAIEPSYQLSHVMRYDGGILALATDIRNNIESQHCPMIPAGVDNIVGLSAMTWERFLIKSFKESNFAENPNAIRALAYRNDRVNQLNSLIRLALYPGVVDRFVEGEILVANEPIFKWDNEWNKEEIVMQTCQECRVNKVSIGVKKIASKLTGQSIEVKVYNLTIESAGEAIEVMAVHEDSMNAIAAFMTAFRLEITKLGNDSDKAEQKRLRKDHWNDYFWLMKDLNLVLKGKNFMHRLQCAYALTIHKSEGSTIDVVFSDFRDIMAGRDSKTKNQLRYVALTRAKECAVILK